MELTRNIYADKDAYSGRSHYSLPEVSFGIIWIIVLDNSSSAHVDNKMENILVLSYDPTQRLVNTTITAEAKYIYFTESGKRFVLSLFIC